MNINNEQYKTAVRLSAAWVSLNVPLWIVAAALHLNRPILNVDLFIPLVVMQVSGIGSVGALLTLWTVDWIVANSAQFYFSSPVEFLTSARFLHALSWTSYLTPTLFLLAVPFGCAIAILLRSRCAGPRPLRGSLAVAFALCSLAVLLDIANGSSQLMQGRATMVVPINLAGSPLRVLLRSSLNGGSGAIAKIGDARVDRARAQVQAWGQAHPDRSIVYVIVESWGIHADERINQYFADTVMKGLKGTYSLEQSRVPFSGSTTIGELRELCGTRGSYLGLTSDNSAGCLPNSFAQRGWNTVGVHGFSKRMFLREEWWPKIGLHQTVFFENFSKASAQHCGGVFAGVCDAEVIDTAFRLATTPRNFVYALTLNSHLPLVDTPAGAAGDQACAAMALDPSICVLTKRLSIVFSSINRSILAADPEHAPLVIIVGDHAPPFGDSALRQRYSQKEVAKFILRPRP